MSASVVRAAANGAGSVANASVRGEVGALVSGERKGQQAGAKKQQAGDGDCQKTVGGEFVTYGSDSNAPTRAVSPCLIGKRYVAFVSASLHRLGKMASSTAAVCFVADG